MDRPLNVALVGYGLAGKVFHAPLIRATPGLCLHTVVSSDAQKVLADHAQVHVAGDAAAVFADRAIDLVVIAAPNAMHAPLAMAALAGGKHVVVDKPFALDLAQAREMVAAAARAKRIVSVFQNRRWDADFLTLRALVEAEALGDLSEFHSHFDRHRPQVAVRWRESSQPGAGLWYDLGPHLLDQALQLFGLPTAVFADLGRQREAAQADDYFNVLLRYPRLRAVLHGGSLVADNRLRFAVHGVGGSFVKHGMDTQEDALRRGQVPGTAGWGQDPCPGQLRAAGTGGTTSSVAGVPGNYLRYYQAMHAAITRGQRPPVTTREALQVMAVLDAARQSAAQGREIACLDPCLDMLEGS